MKPGTDSHRVLQILALGNLHQLVALGPEGVAPLLELLRHGPPNKQFSAVKALGEISDPPNSGAFAVSCYSSGATKCRISPVFAALRRPAGMFFFISVL